VVLYFYLPSNSEYKDILFRNLGHFRTEKSKVQNWWFSAELFLQQNLLLCSSVSTDHKKLNDISLYSEFDALSN
jgi:hypothetical protein